jgi:hypothetical protein
MIVLKHSIESRLGVLVDESIDFWQKKFAESNWPLMGTFRSYLFFRIHGLISDYSRERDLKTEALLMNSYFEGFRKSMEALELDDSIRTRTVTMFEDLDGNYVDDGIPKAYPNFKRSVFQLLDYMDEAANRVGWHQQQVDNNFLVILDAQDPTADTDLELRAELNESADLLKAIVKDVKTARDEVLWDGSNEAIARYFSSARVMLQDGSDYEEFRREYTPGEDPRMVAQLREQLDDLELTLEVNELWVKYTR